ncbi:MAG: hypothetical protein DI558_06955 [Corynebacterium propinquum]|nr:MAG: hypothetical protein DI558_06955 [Corynebacterium propinquum]
MSNLSAGANGNGNSAGFQQQMDYNAYDNYGGQGGYAPMSQQQEADRPMTVDDVVTKTGITLGVIILFAVVNFGIGMVNPQIAMMATFAGAIAGFVTVLVASFGKKWGSPVVTLLYAVFEGLFVGGISLVFSGMYVGEANAASLIGQAVLGTVGVFLGMLIVYKTGAVKVTPRFNKILTSCIIGVVVLMLGNFLLAMFTGNNPLRDGGILAIIFSLVCIGLAAASFLTDFDAADRMIRAGAPSKMAWGVALGLAVTLVWLYTEILRLLSYFQQR